MFIDLTTYEREFDGTYTWKTYRTQHLQGTADEYLYWRVGAADRRNYAGPDAYFEMPYVDTSEGLGTTRSVVEAWIERRDAHMIAMGGAPTSRSLATNTLARLAFQEQNEDKLYDGPPRTRHQRHGNRLRGYSAYASYTRAV